MEEQRKQGVNKGLVAWGAVLTGLFGLVGLGIAVFGEKWKRRDRLIGAGIAVGLWVALIVLISVAAVAGTDDAATVKAPTSTSGQGQPTQPAGGGDSTNVPSQEPTETDDKPDLLNLSIGQTAKIGDAEVTVMGVRRQTGAEFVSPDAGNVWIIVDVLITNTGDDEYNLSSLLQTDVRDASGRTHDLAIFADTNGQLDGSIPAGDILRGEEAFEVPLSATGVQFVFKQSFGSQQARWTLY